MTKPVHKTQSGSAGDPGGEWVGGQGVGGKLGGWGPEVGRGWWGPGGG